METFTPQILRFDSVPSTNLEAAKRAIKGEPEGLCVVAREQTAGRGRLQRHWISPKDAGLYFSIILRPGFEQNLWPLLTLMAAVAVHDALLTACNLESDIKWPNDIMISDKKLCGILAETVETTLGRAVVVGIGIDLTCKAFPAELLDIATSVHAATNKISDPDIVMQALIRALQRRYEMLQLPEGAENMIREWSSRSSYATGKWIRVSDGDEEVEGMTDGLERDGALRVKTNTGEIRTIRAGDVTSLRPSNPTIDQSGLS
jgi:BirA family biotin operon repressor/biotin-[acetyl-CoA-carboxylase] ligase